MDGWMDGWVEAEAELRIVYSNQKARFLIILKLTINGGQFIKMVRFLKIKFLIISKLNYNGGQFYTK